jgi:hypothetical protein
MECLNSLNDYSSDSVFAFSVMAVMKGFDLHHRRLLEKHLLLYSDNFPVIVSKFFPFSTWVWTFSRRLEKVHGENVSEGNLNKLNVADM